MSNFLSIFRHQFKDLRIDIDKEDLSHFEPYNELKGENDVFYVNLNLSKKAFEDEKSFPKLFENVSTALKQLVQNLDFHYSINFRSRNHHQQRQLNS